MTDTMTITEALAELKTLSKRVAKKRQFIGEHLIRQEKFKDPLEGDGGSRTVIKNERQSVADLEKRIIAIRLAIAAVVNGRVKSLTWRSAEHHANARLIAAAPDLLEALKHAVSIIETHIPKDALGTDYYGDTDVPGGTFEWPLLEEYLHHMKSAINKATGRES